MGDSAVHLRLMQVHSSGREMSMVSREFRSAVLGLLLLAGCATGTLAQPSAYERGLQALAEKRDADAIEPLREALALSQAPERPGPKPPRDGGS